MAATVISAATPPPPKVRNLHHLRQLHAHSIKTGASSNPFSMAPLIAASALSLRPSLLSYAHLLFLQIPNPDLFLFNLMIRAHSQSQSPSTSLSLFLRLLSLNLQPNHLTFPFLFKACNHLRSLPTAKILHGFVAKSGLSRDPFVQSSLLSLYFSFGLWEFAQKVFDEMGERDLVCLTTMVVGFARLGMADKAREIFDGMRNRDFAAWSAMITGYVQSGCFVEGLELFDEMRRCDVYLNEAGVVSVLLACSHLSRIESGEWLHRYVIERKMIGNPIVATALVDMYSKCGKIQQAMEIFESIGHKSLISWTVMIKALAVHGMVTEALYCLTNMKLSGIEPDGTVFVGILSACAHAGLVVEGRKCFLSIPSPGLDHYACMVDLLGRAGLFEEAEEVINGMPMDPDEAIWGALLNSCKIHENVELGERAGRELMKLGTEDGGHFVLLANLYASCGRWDDALSVRRMMGEEGIERLPGWSNIEIAGVTHKFVAGDQSHPKSELIYSKLSEMVEKVRAAGYIEDLRGCLLDVDEAEKKRSLMRHSERLAVAFGLISSEAGQTLYVIKSLRVCWDCHCFLKLVSHVFERKIVMRDRNRFHHFAGGACSCCDYW